MIKQGDTVVVDNVTSYVETMWGQGRHTAYRLTDGRVVLDLDKLVASGKATLINSKPIVASKPFALNLEDVLKYGKPSKD